MNEPLFRLIQCRVCGWKFHTPEALRDHRAVQHNKRAPPAPPALVVVHDLAVEVA